MIPVSVLCGCVMVELGDWMGKGEKLLNLLRLRTNPIAIRFFKNGEEIPAGIKRAKSTIGYRVLACQTMAMVRRYGWTFAMTWEEDLDCIAPAVMWGFAKEPEYVSRGQYLAGNYSENLDVAKKAVSAQPRIPFGLYKAVVFSPLHKTQIEPQLVAIYGSPAQISKVTVSLLWKRGSPLTSSFGSGGEICGKIAVALQKNEPQISVPGGGDRIFAGTEEDEMAIVVPAVMVDNLIDGFEKTNRIYPYPIGKYLRYEPKLPKNYPVTHKDYESACSVGE